jgi:hypothetical protein
MREQKIYTKPQEAQTLQTNFTEKNRAHGAPDHEAEPPRVSSKYDRKNFYEKRMHHPDGPGGNYEGL